MRKFWKVIEIQAIGQVKIYELTKLLRFLAWTIQVVLKSQTSFIFSSTATKSTESNSELSNHCIIEYQFRSRTSVVQSESPNCEWKLPNSTSKFFKNKSRWIRERWFCSLPWTSSRTIFRNNNIKSSRRLDQDQYIRLDHHLLEIFKTFSRRLQDVLSRPLQNVFKTSSRHLIDVLHRCLQDLFKT